MRNTAEMKGFLEDANYSIGLLDEGVNLGDVIDNCIYEHTLVSIQFSVATFTVHLIFINCICIHIFS